MRESTQRVAIVVDRNFGERLLSLREVDHAWVIESEANSPIVHSFWSRLVRTEPTGMPVGMTLFRTDEAASPQSACLMIADTVDEHHGEWSAAGPWTEIAVVGTVLTPQLEAQFYQLGAEDFVATEEGFRCRRAHP
jgi:hypothetical protein